MPRANAVSADLASGGSPTCQDPTPAESTSIRSLRPRDSTMCLNTPSAVGDRQILPVQTNNTLNTHGLPVWRGRILTAYLSESPMSDSLNQLPIYIQAWREYLPAILPTSYLSWGMAGWQKRNQWFNEDLLPELRRRVHGLIR